ncbi:MAG: hypothetical protein FWC67_00180 [Defluviitaleaceae bacterium]|nr:hypothetical protein [Defluviitaleaceae bacterium]
MIKEITEKDFARGIKNPYFDKLMTKTEVALRKEDYLTFLRSGRDKRCASGDDNAQLFGRLGTKATRA